MSTRTASLITVGASEQISVDFRAVGENSVVSPSKPLLFSPQTHSVTVSGVGRFVRSKGKDGLDIISVESADGVVVEMTKK